MLRRKLSAGLLRATTPTPSVTAPICPPSPSRQRARGLASAVLLSSQRNWRGETVVALKSELKKRGLSQQGNKAALVARLESAEASCALPPMPPFTNAFAVRGLSTTASTAFPPKSKAKPAETPSAASDTAPTATPVDEPSLTSAGPTVSSQRTEALKPEPIEPERVTVAPGLPETKLDTHETHKKLDVQLPKPAVEREIEQVIPLVPDNFSSNAALPESSKPEPDASSAGPKILTVAGSATHLEGGPVHGVHPTVELDKAEEVVKDVASALPGLATTLGNVLSAPGNALRSVGIRMPAVNLPEAPKGKEAEYKADDKPLNSEEKRGAWILAGVVGLGLFLGGPKKDKKAHGHASELAEKAKAKAAGVVGDAQWEKASGAGVVGHGARKD